MGYCIEMTESMIEISLENTERILELRDKLAEYRCGYVCKGFNYNFGMLMEDLRYKVTFDYDKNVFKITEFVGEKFRSDDVIFDILAPYLNDGYIEFIGEEGDYFRYVIKDGKMTEYRGRQYFVKRNTKLDTLDFAYENYQKMCDKYSGIECEDCSLEHTDKCYAENFDELGHDCICCTPDGKEICKYKEFANDKTNCFINYLKDNYNVILGDKVM